MSTQFSDIRDTALLSLACVFGALLVPLLPVAGLPLCAAGVGGLAFRGHRVQLAIAVTLGTVVSMWIRPVDAIATGVALAALVAAAARLRRSDAYAIVLWLAPLLGLGFAATEFAAARLGGMSFGAYLSSAMEQAAQVFGTAGLVGGIPVDELTQTMLRFTPAVYLLLGVASAVPSLFALVWAATRTGAVIRPNPRLARVDLSPHVLWPLVAGVGLLAAGRIWGGAEGAITTAGLNLLMVARVALLLQGLALAGALLDKAGVRGPGRAVGLLFALVLDSASWFVSLAGLSDFWLNFRRLNRGIPAEGASGPAQGL